MSTTVSPPQALNAVVPYGSNLSFANPVELKKGDVIKSLHATVLYTSSVTPKFYFDISLLPGQYFKATSVTPTGKKVDHNLEYIVKYEKDIPVNVSGKGTLKINSHILPYDVYITDEGGIASVYATILPYKPAPYDPSKPEYHPKLAQAHESAPVKSGDNLVKYGLIGGGVLLALTIGALVFMEVRKRKAK